MDNRTEELRERTNEFVSKIGIVLEEADETAFWIEFLADAKVMKKERVEKLLNEAHELTAIFAASRKTAKGSGDD